MGKYAWQKVYTSGVHNYELSKVRINYLKIVYIIILNHTAKYHIALA